MNAQQNKISKSGGAYTGQIFELSFLARLELLSGLSFEHKFVIPGKFEEFQYQMSISGATFTNNQYLRSSPNEKQLASCRCPWMDHGVHLWTVCPGPGGKSVDGK